MSRDANGNYTLPAGNPVVSGTDITVTWGNTTMDDIAVAMTDSLSRSGKGGMTAPFKNAAGTAATPGITWTSDPNSGFYSAGADSMGLTLGGTVKVMYDTTAIDFYVGVKTDTISEHTSDAGVTIDDVLLKDGAVQVGSIAGGVQIGPSGLDANFTPASGGSFDASKQFQWDESADKWKFETDLQVNGDYNSAGGVSVSGNGTFEDITANGDILVDEFFAPLNTPELTIASGIITVTGISHLVDTEGNAATDTLITMNGAVYDRQPVDLRTVSSSRDTTITNADNIKTGDNGASRALASTLRLFSASWNSASSVWIERYFTIV